jgi:hypothetical protein
VFIITTKELNKDLDYRNVILIFILLFNISFFFVKRWAEKISKRFEKKKKLI